MLLSLFNQLDDGKSARRDLKSNAVLATSRYLQILLAGPLLRAGDSLPAQVDRHRHSGAAIDLGQTLLWLEHTVVVEECHHPAVIRTIDQILDIAIDLYRSCVCKQMREQMRGKGCDAFVFTQKVGQSNKY